MSTRRVAVLGYHKIGPPPDEWWSWQYVPADVFAAQIDLLRHDGWHPISADELVAGFEAPELLPENSFLVTFDDAYRSLVDDGLDYLERLRLPAVVFAPTDFVGGWNRFDHDIEPREEICDWEALRELERRGVTIGSHGVTHRGFSMLGLDEQEREAIESRRVLEDELRSPVELLAYPYGDVGDERRLPDLLQRAGYRAAFGYGGGAFELPSERRYQLPRLAMGPDTDVREELLGLA